VSAIPEEAVTAAAKQLAHFISGTERKPYPEPDAEDIQWAISALEAAAPFIAAAERERIYAELGNDHFVIFTEDRWTIEHSVECRLSGHMHECDQHEAVARVAVGGFDPRMAGRWRIDGIDSEGLPNLVRADPAEATADP